MQKYNTEIFRRNIKCFIIFGAKIHIGELRTILRYVGHRNRRKKIDSYSSLCLLGGETFSMCFWSDMKGKVLFKYLPGRK